MPATAADFAPLRFSTSDLPKRERLSRWREEFGRGLVRVDIEPLSDGPFHAEATLQALPGVRMASCAGSAARFNRTRVMAAEGDDSIGLVVNLNARATVAQRGKDVTLRPGDAVFVLTQEPGILTSTGQLGILLPRAAIAARFRNVDDMAMRVIPHAFEPLRLLVSYLGLVQDKIVLATPGLRQAMASHIHDLAALALGANRPVTEDGLSAVAAARLAAALGHIAESFTQPDLALATVARRQGISPRYLQRLLEASGTSFTARVNELRLQRACALLTEPHRRGRRISDVALQAGFSDISHFNRLFRFRFGDSPSGIRARRSQPLLEGLFTARPR
jgi:AraC-like DNA-binding protein